MLRLHLGCLAVNLRGALMHLGLVLAATALVGVCSGARRPLGLVTPAARAALTLPRPAAALDCVGVQVSLGHRARAVGLPD